MRKYKSLGLLLAAVLNGCAVHYYDPDTQAEHVWGIGHMRMKAEAAREDNKAIVKGVELYGIGLGFGRQDYYAVLGWDRRTLLSVVDKDTSVRLEWPSSDFFDVRVGSRPPFLDDKATKLTNQ